MYDTPKADVKPKGYEQYKYGRIFNKLIYINIFLTLIVWLLPSIEFLFLSAKELEVYNYSGVGHILEYPSWLYYFIIAAYIFSYVAMRLRKSFSKWLYPCVVSASVGASFLWGMTIFSKIDIVPYSIMLHIDGALLVFLFCTPVKEQFK